MDDLVLEAAIIFFLLCLAVGVWCLTKFVSSNNKEAKK